MDKILYGSETRAPYEAIGTDLRAADINNTMAAYLDFLNLEEAERKKLFHLDSEHPRTGESGYVLKTADPSSQETDDNKHFFHVTPTLARHFSPTTLEGRNLAAESRRLIETGSEIYRSLGQAALTTYKDLEILFPLLSNIHFPRDGDWKHKLRLVAYQGGTGQVLARGHYDKGTGTIAVAESHGGLRIGYGPEDLELIQRHRFDPIFFHGYGWHQLAEMLGVDTDRRAAWHDVIDTGERVRKDVMRWAMIYFIDPAHIYLESTKEQTHTPIKWNELARRALSAAI